VGGRVVPVPAGGFRSIAVLRLSSLGDVVLTLPVVRALRAAWPQARLHYWVKEEFAELLRFEPAIDHVRVLERDARALEDLRERLGAEEFHDRRLQPFGQLRHRSWYP